MKSFLIIAIALFSLSACGKKTSDGKEDNNIGADSTDITINNDDSAEIKITVDGEELVIQPKKEETPPAPVLIKDDMQTGTIFKKGDAYIIRETLPSGAIVDYYAENLGEEFKKEGLTVKFKGTLLEIPSNVRMIGKPIKLTKIVKV